MLPNIEPLIKLAPTIKPIGRDTVLSKIKLTLLLFELFCSPINNKQSRQELNKTTVNIFLIWIVISFRYFIKFNANYKLSFF